MTTNKWDNYNSRIVGNFHQMYGFTVKSNSIRPTCKIMKYNIEIFISKRKNSATVCPYAYICNVKYDVSQSFLQNCVYSYGGRCFKAVEFLVDEFLYSLLILHTLKQCLCHDVNQNVDMKISRQDYVANRFCLLTMTVIVNDYNFN